MKVVPPLPRTQHIDVQQRQSTLQPMTQPHPRLLRTAQTHPQPQPRTLPISQPQKGQGMTPTRQTPRRTRFLSRPLLRPHTPPPHTYTRLFTVYVVSLRTHSPPGWCNLLEMVELQRITTSQPPGWCNLLEWYNTGKVLPALLLLGWFGSMPA